MWVHLWSQLAFLGVFAAAYNDQPARFLLISSPSTGNVYYSEVPGVSTLNAPLRKREVPPEATILIDGELSRCKGSECTDSSDEGLKSPSGLALYQGPSSTTLYVSDEGSENIYAYELASKGKATDFTKGLKVGRQRRVRQGVQGLSGIATDGTGNLYYTTTNGLVEMIPSDELESVKGGDATPRLLYDAKDFDAISSPQDIATDGFHLYWTNLAGGEKAGSLGEALTRPLPPESQLDKGGAHERVGDPRPLTANGPGAWGVCIARGNVFYTAEQTSMFAVKTTGGSIAEVTHQMVAPRGCTYDGESTIYVADSGDNGIFSLVASPSLRAVRHLHKVVTVTDPNQVVVFHAKGRQLQGEELPIYIHDSGALQGCRLSSASRAIVTAAALVLWTWRS